MTILTPWMIKASRDLYLIINSWVTVEGFPFTSEYEYNGQTCYTPELTVTEITPAKAVEGYVYAH